MIPSGLADSHHSVEAFWRWPRLGLLDFLSVNDETLEDIRAERSGNRDIGSVTAARDEDTSNARNEVPRVERIPAASEERLEPRREVHRFRRRRHADVAQIAGAVSRWDVHAAAERHGEVSVIAAHAGPLVVRLRCRFGGSRELVSELEVPMDEGTDRLHSRPAEVR